MEMSWGENISKPVGTLTFMLGLWLIQFDEIPDHAT